jgi:thiol-disulfide isomerase/thioredoxin
MIVRFFLILIAYFFSLSLLAQKHFILTVELPHGIKTDKVEAWLEDGKTKSKKIAAQSKTGNVLKFTGEYYSIYAAINLQYEAEPPIKRFANTFFIQEKPASVKFYPSDSLQYPFKNYALENTLDFKEEKKQMNDYVFAERKKTMDYENRYGDKIYSDTVLLRPYQKLMDSFRRKILEYIVSHLNSYYSFYSFRVGIVGTKAVSSDSELIVFNAFPDTFRYTDEGNYLNAVLQVRQSNKSGTAVDFTAKDINEKNVTLANFKGSKYVLLHFWATWCSPCVKELPAVKDLNDKYKSKDLQIISVSWRSSKYSDYLVALKKYGMDWINIYNNGDIFYKYGNQATPRICLIDKDGRFIYDSIDFARGDNELIELNKILKATLN